MSATLRLKRRLFAVSGFWREDVVEPKLRPISEVERAKFSKYIRPSVQFANHIFLVDARIKNELIKATDTEQRRLFNGHRP